MKKSIIIVFLFCVGFINAQNENYKIQNLEVNTEHSDFGVAYYGDSIAIYASSKKIRSIVKRNWKQNNQPYLELYSGSILSDGEINESDYFSETLKTKFHESNVAFTNDFKTVYFSADNYIKGKGVERDTTGWVNIQMYRATVATDGKWTNIVSMPFNNNNYSTGHPTVNKSGDKLYFTSDMPNGYGLTDIWAVDINKDGTYGDPINLGATVNTSGKEMFPFISDKDQLYFSSDGREGIGELDIYVTQKSTESDYYIPINLGEPLNSLKDDFSIAYRNGSKFGHFSSNRDGGKGDDDIYYFEELIPTVFECNQVVKGIVKDEKTGELLAEVLVTLYTKEGKKIESMIVGADAAFEFALDCETDYRVVGEKEKYNSDEKVFLTTDENKLEFNLGLNLEPVLPQAPTEFVEVNGKILIKINPIYFDYDKSFIRSDAAIELDQVIAVMKKYPSLIVEGGSHTDSRGRDAYNEGLSLRRANSTVNYIINNGEIDSSRISARGYGETQLTNHCGNGIKCSKEEHQLNRRTEFVIVNPDVINK